ncbi:MAG: hypothetical protein H9847_09280 [Candidatus Anaerobiospirillum pullicola]|uniref:Uncharacterized protein n=1 Tax=Candidatus Anaerobiospirillum pullicola TaxID=2838451 RepID=A0A948TI07_9GAMM|nr:hypothetical protein [Candidatus Anaerobiospirillum pullicola]
MATILVLTPFSLHDSINAAASNCWHMVHYLKQNGQKLTVLSPLNASTPLTAQPALQALSDKLRAAPSGVYAYSEAGINFFYTRSATGKLTQMSLTEGELLWQQCHELLTKLKPEILLVCGLCPVTQACISTAAVAGIHTTLVLEHNHYSSYACPDIELLLTFSESSARYYAQHAELNVLPLGHNGMAVVTQSDKRARRNTVPPAQPQFVTLFQPTAEHGLALFAKLALVCKQELPQARFLAVTYGTHLATAWPRLHELTPKEQPHGRTFSAADFPNVFTVDAPESREEVWDNTALLLLPELRANAWEPLATEAVLHKIPVIGSNAGGLQESTGGACMALPLPRSLEIDPYALPTDAEIKPWVAGLKYMLSHNVQPLLTQGQQKLLQERQQLPLLALLQDLGQR